MAPSWLFVFHGHKLQYFSHNLTTIPSEHFQPILFSLLLKIRNSSLGSLLCFYLINKLRICYMYVHLFLMFIYYIMSSLSLLSNLISTISKIFLQYDTEYVTLWNPLCLIIIHIHYNLVFNSLTHYSDCFCSFRLLFRFKFAVLWTIFIHHDQIVKYV